MQDLVQELLKTKPKDPVSLIIYFRQYNCLIQAQELIAILENRVQLQNTSYESDERDTPNRKKTNNIYGKLLCIFNLYYININQLYANSKQFRTTYIRRKSRVTSSQDQI